MYKYTILPAILKHYKKPEYRSQDRWRWTVYIEQYVKPVGFTNDKYISHYISYSFPKNFVFYSKKSRSSIPVCGHLVQVHGLFLEEHIPD